MNDDLVRRLRCYADVDVDAADYHPWVYGEAADEIERLRARRTKREVMVEHRLKTLPPYFDAVARGEKNFEVRRDDRGFQKGDVVILAWYNIGLNNYLRPNVDTIRRRISYILTGGQFGIAPGYVVLALEPENEVEANPAEPTSLDCPWVGGNDITTCRTCGAEYDCRREPKPACPLVEKEEK